MISPPQSSLDVLEKLTQRLSMRPDDLYEQIIERSPSGVFVVSSNGLVQYMNHKARKFFTECGVVNLEATKLFRPKQSALLGIRKCPLYTVLIQNQTFLGKVYLWQSPDLCKLVTLYAYPLSLDTTSSSAVFFFTNNEEVKSGGSESRSGPI
jgi:hypothetical protein